MNRVRTFRRRRFESRRFMAEYKAIRVDSLMQAGKMFYT
jgi:hypothetical protein